MDREEKDFLLEKVMVLYGDELVRLAFSYVKDAETAKDLIQNTFIKCYSNLDSFRHDAHIKTWLYRLAINECKDYLKSWNYRKNSCRLREIAQASLWLASDASSYVTGTIIHADAGCTSR